MRVLFLIILFFGLIKICKSQTKYPLTEIITEISSQWKQDSNSCKGYRLKVFQKIIDSKLEPITKDFIFSKFGKPNQIQKFYSGNTHKNYVGYIYDTYKDNCPKIEFEGHAIQFVFDSTESFLIEITEIDYCG